MTATLRRKRWLFREWDVTTPEGVYVVAYSGLGFGSESVSVNGSAVVTDQGFLWFVPRFDFQLGVYQATVEVRVSPLIMLRFIRLTVAGEVCYSEGY